MISASGTHSALVLEGGQILVCGSDLHGKLGQKAYSKFQTLTHLKNVEAQKIYCSEYNTVCLLKDGQLYSWGGSVN